MKYRVAHGTYVSGNHDDNRMEHPMGSEIEMTEEEAKAGLAAGTLEKASDKPGDKPVSEDDHDALRVKAAEGAPKGSQEPEKAAADWRKEQDEKTKQGGQNAPQPQLDTRLGTQNPPTKPGAEGDKGKSQRPPQGSGGGEHR